MRLNLRDLFVNPKPTDHLTIFLTWQEGSYGTKVPVINVRAVDCKHSNAGKHHDCRIPESPSPFDPPVDESKFLEPETLRSDKRDNLVISEDVDFDETPQAVLLYTPDMDDTSDHSHIELDINQAEKMYAWLGRFLLKHKP